MGDNLRTFLIWGAGEHGKVVADLVRASEGRIAGFVDADPAKLGREAEPGGARVIMAQEELVDGLRENGCYPQGIDAVALAIGDNGVRQRCLLLLGGYTVPSLVHPSAVVSPSVRFGRGTVVYASAVVNAAACIGGAVIINSAAVVEHDCFVADGAHVSPGAVLAGRVRLGERSSVGAGATVIPGVVIGADVAVGAGAVVIRDVPDGTTVAGVPAKATRSS
jgi:UDP-perosamine 4-acetyltransferase